MYDIKFHGKPVNILPLKNSNIEKIVEKIKIKEIFFSAKLPTIKIDKPKNYFNLVFHRYRSKLIYARDHFTYIEYILLRII